MTERVRYKYHTVRCIIETSIGSLIVQTIKASYSQGHRINMERELVTLNEKPLIVAYKNTGTQTTALRKH
jgi:hypothetical protein